MENYCCYRCESEYTSLYNVIKHFQLVHDVHERLGGDERIRCVKSRLCPSRFNSFKAAKAHSKICRFNQQNNENMPVLEEVNQQHNDDIDEIIYNDRENNPEAAGDQFREPNDAHISPEETFRTMNILILSILKCLVSLKIPKDWTKLFSTSLNRLFFQLMNY